ncbi:chromosome segregation protein Smc [Lactobacillus taiwanensis DSM 21401]|uniref:chromosome segregation protein SMC n=1 Tax=Lactobacillus taiwanensis TaxID=508451 RepID=UPI0006EE95A0|nr:chromosome segregation protein SMC [Lactobacillus taiwanensis]KRM99038.1 chromosome segregation protein Smc [Lactobacillus taiwanensis DSM 21401]
MPLQQLVLNGFKSFADKTIISFNNGITGIVGPNGSGKSNITEAIRWVMGEGSAKSLRGENMKDVIFAGSQMRAPMNHAEVELIFDNRDHQLASDDDEVVVTRKILRNGESDYLLNHHPVRLKDVKTLFIESGMSSDSLGIISQGKVDEILNSKPQQRREIFEEAAGVLHFKQQKEIALKQLDKTNANLIRINDLVKELEGRIEPLHEQSSLAKEYKFQKDQLDHKLKQLLGLEIESLNEEKKAVAKKAATNQGILNKLDDEVKQSQADLEEKRKQSNKRHAEKDEKQQELLALTQKIAALNTDLQMHQQSREYDVATQKEYTAQSDELKERQKHLLKQLDSNEKDLVSQNKILANFLKKQKKLKQELKQGPEQLNNQLEKVRSDYIQTLQDQTSNNNEIVYLKNELTRNQKSTDSRQQEVEEQLSESQQILDQLKKQGHDLVLKRKKLNEEISVLDQKIAQKSKLKDQNEQNYFQVRNNLQQISAQVEGLKRIRDRHEGYYYGVKYVLNHQSDFHGIVGVIGELISFPAELEAALSTALGGGVQDLVTLDQNSARDAINLLKQTRTGRATFLPLDGLRHNEIAASTIKSLQSIDGFKGVAANLVTAKTDIDISNAISYLLGNVLVVDTIDTALRVQRRIGRHYRIVTLDGDIISPGGSMTGGTRNTRNNSPLATNAEIDKLTAQIKASKEKFVKLQEILNGLNQVLNELQAELETKKSNLTSLNQQISEQAIKYENEEKEVKRLTQLNDLQQKAQLEKKQEEAELSTRLEKQQAKKVELEELAQKQRTQMDQLKYDLSDFDEAYQKLQNELSNLNSDLAVVKNKLENITAKKTELEEQLTNTNARLKDIDNKIKALTLSQNGQSETEVEEQVSRLSEKRKQMQKALAEINQDLGKFDAQINNLDQVATRNYNLRKNTAAEQEEYSAKLGELKSQINQKLKTLSEEYSLTFEAALQLSKGQNTTDLRRKLEREVHLHKMSLADIGEVNLNSIEEYEDVKTRYDFLNGQQTDLLNARKDIEESMSKLDDEVKSRFSATFHQIEKSFAKIFPIMFDGGHARLELTDPKNLLETGIEIIAQPPGKKSQKLTLLSGGERALTAITLLFAMLQVNPVPFCILDEVEAALDETNVDRFAQFLNRYDMKTQFIVITHRRGTMQKADNLYGIVMQESGISKVLSVSLNEIKKEVK